MRTTIALAALAASTFWLNVSMARAEVYTYECQGRAVKLDDTAGTIAVNGRVFSNADLIDGCRYNFRATDKDGSTAELCTSTQGYASLTIAAKSKKPL
jgi:hypothetical protein